MADSKNPPRPNRKSKVVTDHISPEKDPKIFESVVTENIKKDLRQVQESVVRGVTSQENRIYWDRARLTVEGFRPIPWYIWRLSNFTLGKEGEIRTFGYGMVFALDKLIHLVGSDPEMCGSREKIDNPQEVIQSAKPDVFAAAAIIHSVCQRFKDRQFKRIWRPILEEAILRTRIGFSLGLRDKAFSSGRAMLAGFAGRAGLAIQIATGTLEQATEALERVATGDSIQRIGIDIYSCEPLQISAMLLIACGCGRDAAYGVMSVASPDLAPENSLTDTQKRWRSALLITEAIRTGDYALVNKGNWAHLGFQNEEDIFAFRSEIRQISRRGHTWGWLSE